MRILFVSKELIGSALVHRLLHEGHQLRVYIEDATCAHCLDGFVTKSLNWRDDLDWVGQDGLIIFDDVGWKGVQAELRAGGFRVVGGDEESDRLELDREHFREVLSQNGIPTLESYNFASVSHAREFIQKNPSRWVLKHSSHMSTATFVGKQEDGTDVLELLHIYEARGISPIHLQKAVSGIEIGVARYFNGNDWIGPIEVNIEHKALFPGDIGPLTCEMGTLVWYEYDDEMPLFRETLGKLKPHLEAIQYKGDIDINCIVNEDGIWPLEATTRFGSPATQVQCELHQSPWGEFLSAIADGGAYDLKVRDGFAVGVTIATPPFPFGSEFMSDYVPGPETRTKVFLSNRATLEDLRKIHFEEAVLERVAGEEIIYHRGGIGYAAFVTGFGSTPTAAQKDAYRVVDLLHIPRMFYRTDIGEKFIRDDAAALAQLGLLRSMVKS